MFPSSSSPSSSTSHSLPFPLAGHSPMFRRAAAPFLVPPVSHLTSATAVFSNANPVQPVQKKRSPDIGSTAQHVNVVAPMASMTAQSTSSNGVEKVVECICDRDQALVVCRRCGHDLVGRVQLSCPQHPKRILLMDLRECPNPACRSVQLSEIKLVAVPK